MSASKTSTVFLHYECWMQSFNSVLLQRLQRDIGFLNPSVLDRAYYRCGHTCKAAIRWKHLGHMLYFLSWMNVDSSIILHNSCTCVHLYCYYCQDNVTLLQQRLVCFEQYRAISVFFKSLRIPPSPKLGGFEYGITAPNTSVTMQ